MMTREQMVEWADSHGYTRVRCPHTGQISYSDVGVCECNACEYDRWERRRRWRTAQEVERDG